MYREDFVEETYKKALDFMYWTFKTRQELIDDCRNKIYRNDDYNLHISLMGAYTDMAYSQIRLIEDILDIPKETIEEDLIAML